MIEAAKMGAHVATLPPAVMRQLFQHPLTDKGLAAFLADWDKTGQCILKGRPAPWPTASRTPRWTPPRRPARKSPSTCVVIPTSWWSILTSSAS